MSLRILQAYSDGSLYGNYAASPDSTVTADAVQDGYTLANAFDPDEGGGRLGEPAQLEPCITFYSSGARQNNVVVVTVSAVDYTCTFTAGKYNGDAAATHINAVLDATTGNTDWAWAFQPSSGRMTDRNTTTGYTLKWTDALSNAGTSLGYDDTADDVRVSVSTNLADDIMPVNADSSTSSGSHGGHWVKVDLGGSEKPEYFGFHTIRQAPTNGDTQIPNGSPEGLDCYIYSHSSDLGDSIGDWIDSATEVVDGADFQHASASILDFRYEARVHRLASQPAANQWWLFRFVDTSTQSGYPWLRIPYLLLGIETEVGSTDNLRPNAESSRPIGREGSTVPSEGADEFTTVGAWKRRPSWNISQMSDTEREELLAIRIRNGLAPMFMIIDDSALPTVDATLDHRQVILARLPGGFVGDEIANYSTAASTVQHSSITLDLTEASLGIT